jgi:hypothetical protein
VIRVLDVPAARTLPEPHDLVRVRSARGQPPHLFVARAARCGVPDEDGARPDNESDVTVGDLSARLAYLNDLGDWPGVPATCN